MKPWELIKKNIILQNQWLTVEKNDYKKSNGEIAKDFYKINRNDFALIVAIDSNNNVVMVKQFRVGPNKIMLELPAGFIEPNESPVQTALRELQEETGYVGKNAKLIGSFYPSPGFLSIRGFIVKIEVDGKQEIANQDANEEIEVLKIPLKDIYKMIKTNEINDLGAIAALELCKELEKH